MGLSLPHLLVVLAIVILLFGTKRLKTIGTDLGDAIKGFRNSVKEEEQADALAHRDHKELDEAVSERSQTSI